MSGSCKPPHLYSLFKDMQVAIIPPLATLFTHNSIRQAF